MIVVITGASAGVGRATAHKFAAQGWDVAVLARNAVRLEAAAEEIRRYGVRARPLVVDVADGNAVKAAAAQIERELRPIGRESAG
jgi:NADP-dependent 3-hydroxy acid dehydrogenase YdfG